MRCEIGEGVEQVVPLRTDAVVTVITPKIGFQREGIHQTSVVLPQDLESALNWWARTDLDDFLAERGVAVTQGFQDGCEGVFVESFEQAVYAEWAA
jgi:hypothetical protein